MTLSDSITLPNTTQIKNRMFKSAMSELLGAAGVQVSSLEGKSYCLPAVNATDQGDDRHAVHFLPRKASAP